MPRKSMFQMLYFIIDATMPTNVIFTHDLSGAMSAHRYPASLSMTGQSPPMTKSPRSCGILLQLGKNVLCLFILQRIALTV